jgi:hypothetical protein
VNATDRNGQSRVSNLRVVAIIDGAKDNKSAERSPVAYNSAIFRRQRC